MRIPYRNLTSENADISTEESAIIDRIKQRRLPRPWQPLDLALLHSPAVADGWNSFIGAIRTRTSLDDLVREIAISRVAVVNEAWYEWGHHAPLGQAAGLSEEGLKVLRKSQLPEESECRGKLSQREWLVAAVSDAMSRSVKVPEDLFDALKGNFSNQQIVELAATVRFLVTRHEPTHF